MSDHNRSKAGISPAISGNRIISPAACQAGVHPVTMPIIPNPYGMISGQPHQYMPQVPYVQHPVRQNRMPLVGAIPPGMTGMYVPVAQIPGPQVLSSQMPAIQISGGLISPGMDPSKLLEQQKKFEKERNFQLQQQRLKQFTVAGKKGSINADNLIDSMFGKSHSKDNSQQVSQVSSKPVDSNENRKLFENTVVQPSAGTNPSIGNLQYPSNVLPPKSSQLQFQPNQPSQLTVKADKKELDAMMLQCSDFKGPQKANKFSKPPVKEIPPPVKLRSTFTASNKARDWNNITGLDQAFVEKRSRFPGWCCKEKVPELFKMVEDIVTGNGTHVPGTKLLFPILISSGLSQQYLAQIWEMVNKSASGYLTNEEMYAALALVAVAQAGHNIQNSEILHQLPSCPTPNLQCFMKSAKTEETENLPTSTPSDTVTSVTSPNDSKDISGSFSHQVIRPSAISLQKSNIGFNASNTIVSPSYTLPISSGSISSPDDEFDDFKSATPTCINFSMFPNSATATPDDEFDDFKQAPTVTSNPRFDNEMKPATSLISSKPVGSLVSSKPAIEEQDLMSSEDDKYSVFRLLQQNDESNNWANFNAVVTPDDSVSNVSTENTKNNDFKSSSDFHNSENLEKLETKISSNDLNSGKDDGDFGDFLHAEVKDSTVATLATKLENFSTDFADFSNFNETSLSVPTLSVPENSQLDDDFGEFASSLPMANKSEIGHEFLFRNLKDNISLAESQSVSSLELGTFDGGGHSGESKSSLSRQGSIPSLDLKSTCLEASESDDCFGELQSAPPAKVIRASKTPSPTKVLNKLENNHIPATIPGSNFQPSKTIPLNDKYSVIRSDERKEEDQHISSWTRCLQSSINILQNTKKIFNQMSCSSVCNEVLSSEEGGNYIKDVIEVYKVACRVKLSSKSFGKQTIAILNLLKEVEHNWNIISGFFAGSPLMPPDSAFNLSPALLSSNDDDISKACGLCLLNVDLKVSKYDEVSLKLSYGGRNYHSTCANFWVNCVDPLLPALILPQLL